MDFGTTEIKNILKGIEDPGFVRKINCKYHESLKTRQTRVQ